MKNTLSIIVPTLISLLCISCSKEELFVNQKIEPKKIRFKMNKEDIPQKIYDIANNLQLCDSSISEEAYQDFKNLNSQEYIQYINLLAYQGIEKYNISIDSAFYILAKRIDYSLYLFNQMPNQLTPYNAMRLGNVMRNIGIPISLDPETWPLRYFHVEKTDRIVSRDSICMTGDNQMTFFYPNIIMIDGDVTLKSCNNTIRQFIHNQFLTAQFDASSQYMLRIEINTSAAQIFDLNFDFILDNTTMTYHFK